MKMIAQGFEQAWTSVPGSASTGVIRKYFSRYSSRNQIVALIMCWFDRSESRRHLAKLDDRMLKDIGLTSHQVEIETKKAFWQS